MSPDRSIHHAPVRGISDADGKIDLPHSSFSKSSQEGTLRSSSLRRHQCASGEFVQPMNDPRPQACPRHVRQQIAMFAPPGVGNLLAHSMEQAIDHSAIPIAWRRVHDDTCFFVDYNTVLIFKDGGQWNGLRCQSKLTLSPQLYPEAVAQCHPSRLLYHDIVHLDEAVGGK
eukprot:scaffold305327_cov37-Tisochrysis_lutea.AAC.2